jgi:hypothetical protein
MDVNLAKIKVHGGVQLGRGWRPGGQPAQHTWLFRGQPEEQDQQFQ